MTTSLLVTAVLAFAATSIDDLVLLTALFLGRHGTGRPPARVIVAGQYAGFAAILAVALVAAAGLHIVPDRWIGLLGLIPIGLGTWGLWQLRGTDETSRPQPAGNLWRIAAVTFANGADNISIFTPLFRTLGTAGSLLATALFLTLVGLWCAIGALLGGRRTATTALGRITHWLVPAVFIAVGLLILLTSSTLTALRHTL